MIAILRQRIAVPIRIIGLLLMMFSLSMLTPLIISFVYQDGFHLAFLLAFTVCLVTGAMAWLLNFRRREELRRRDGFLITALAYIMIGLAGSLPFVFMGEWVPSWTDAVFESLSGLTSTGATVLIGLDNMPPSLLFYRQQLQWLGGMGIIVLAVAILPTLGAGSMTLYRAEAPGALQSGKFTPRIAETAKTLWYIYLVLTVSCAWGYWLAGMSWFDALCHSFSTVSIGGFSTHDASLGHFDNGMVEAVAILFMLISGINFGLHFMVWKRKSPSHYLRDTETRFYISVIIVIFGICAGILVVSGDFSTGEAIRKSLFQTVSIVTTTGYTTDTFGNWPHPAALIIFLGAFMGGCAGSTAGGLKAVRILLVYAHGLRELRRLIHPHAVFQAKLGDKHLSGNVMNTLWGFFSLYTITFLVILVLLFMDGLDIMTGFSATAAMMNNLGPGLGDVAENYRSLSSQAKWLLSFAMILGRLELYALLVLFLPSFWRH